MIVFSGCTNHDCSSQAGVGARYNPNIDNWTAMSSVNAPFPMRQCHCGVDRVRDDHLGRLLGGECQIDQYRWALQSQQQLVGGDCSPSAPFQRNPFVSVWTGTEMLVWGVDSQLLDKSIYRYALRPTAGPRQSCSTPDARRILGRVVWNRADHLGWWCDGLWSFDHWRPFQSDHKHLDGNEFDRTRQCARVA